MPRRSVWTTATTRGRGRGEEAKARKISYLKTAPPILVMLGVYGATALLLASCWPAADLLTCLTSLDVVNETLWRTAC